MITLLVGLVAVLVALQTANGWARDRGRTGRTGVSVGSPSSPPPDVPALDARGPSWSEFQRVALDIAELRTIVQGLPPLWKEEADRANRAAEREEKARKRDRSRRADEEGDGDIAARGHVGGSEQSELLAVPARVAGPADVEAVMSAARRDLARSNVNGRAR